MVGLVVLLFALWLGFAAISYAVARRAAPRGGRVRSLAAAAAGASLLVAPAWLSFCAVMWAQQSARGRRLLGRLGLYSDLHMGGRTEVLQLHGPDDCAACHTGAPCPA